MIEVILYDDFIINYKDLKSSSLAVQLSVDCHMKITVNKKTFYDDWICPIELYFQYCEWRNKCKKMHNYCDFNYITETIFYKGIMPSEKGFRFSSGL